MTDFFVRNYIQIIAEQRLAMMVLAPQSIVRSSAPFVRRGRTLLEGKVDMSDENNATQWVEDGHRITVIWDKDKVEVKGVSCPNEGLTALCNRRRDYCVVERFIEVYGAELNVGRTVVSGPVEVAWAPIIGDSDLDDEFGQIWVCPVDDTDYRILIGDADASE